MLKSQEPYQAGASQMDKFNQRYGSHYATPRHGTPYLQPRVTVKPTRTIKRQTTFVSIDPDALRRRAEHNAAKGAMATSAGSGTGLNRTS